MKTKMPLLLAIFTAVVFFSYGDINDPDISLYPIPENDCDVIYITFVKVSIYPYIWIPTMWEINDCKIGDTIALVYGIYDNIGTYWNNLSESVIARVNTFGGNVTFVKLFDNPNLSYSDVLPPPPRIYNSHTIILNNKSYKDGDVFTAEIKDKNKTLKKTLIVRSK